MPNVHAYVTLVMCGDAYVEGACVMAHSLRLQRPVADLVCLVTDDVSARGRERLHAEFSKVLLVEKLTLACQPLSKERAPEAYAWLADSFTKLHCLSLLQYERVCFLDSDLVVLRNLDHLFAHSLPAAVWMSRYVEAISRRRGAQFRNYYRDVPYGSVIPRTLIDQALRDGFVMSAHLFVTTPRRGVVDSFMKQARASKEPFGSVGCHGGWDEQALALVHQDWIRLPNNYNAIPWHLDECPNVRSEPPFVLHYMGAHKPWQNSPWCDVGIWRAFQQDWLEPSAAVAHDCAYCALAESKLGLAPLPPHPQVRAGRVCCPRLRPATRRRRKTPGTAYRSRKRVRRFAKRSESESLT